MAENNGRTADRKGRPQQMSAGNPRLKSEKKQTPTDGALSEPFRNRLKKRTRSFKINLHKVSKQVHNKLGMSVKTVNFFLIDICEKLIQEAVRLARISKKSIVTRREIQAAAKLILPSELTKHSDPEGLKALTKFKCV